MNSLKYVSFFLAWFLFNQASVNASPDSLTEDRLVNKTAYIPAQCYTDPVANGKVHNPCYVCHTNSKEPNYLDDVDVQLVYNLPEPGLKHSWMNLYKDRTKLISSMKDADVIRYVREDNYKDKSGKIILSEKLKQVPSEWDRNKNKKWDGYIPDVYFNFDSYGFDHDGKGQPTGWRVFAYYPFPGTFMPTNGSSDDVLIRLPEAFRQIKAGIYDQETYRINLAIVESMIKEQDIPISMVDERRYGVDLNKDGKLNTADFIRYDWAPLEKKIMSYVGQAKELLDRQQVHIAARLYPEGTEFLHTVRYLDFDDAGRVRMSARMKEVRYSRKGDWRNYYSLQRIVEKEVKERHDFPERTKQVIGNMEEGLVVAQGWIYQGFIEDKNGNLRPQSYEENYFCVGCHSGVGATTDTTFAFSRKLSASESYKEGWYHWMEKSFNGLSDPVREDGHGEYAFYLKNNPTGNEYRTNTEVMNKFFTREGVAIPSAFEQLREDISHLLIPSADRALRLNKAYKVIVEEQSYVLGRDPVFEPVTSVKKEVEINAETGIRDVLSYY
ncbi:hypothetical protein GJQ54_02630 [Oceanospirillaceae bacterium ASx5O]|nr:hypothetical protein GJQ54_02630 [Oceanospirillaceae bacterium ASx5O]